MYFGKSVEVRSPDFGFHQVSGRFVVYHASILQRTHRLPDHVVVFLRPYLVYGRISRSRVGA